LFKQIKNDFLATINTRLLILFILFIGMGCALIYRTFSLQIVNGQTYIDNFNLKISKESSIPGARGNIYDCNGELLAYNELAYSVTIQDVYESGKTKNTKLNTTIYKLIKMIASNGDKVISDFNIILDEDGNYSFSLEGTKLLRFLADIYGEKLTSDLTYAQKTATPDEVIKYLCSTAKYGLGEYVTTDGVNTFVPEQGYTKVEILEILTIRYSMSSNNYQKYIPTVVSSEVGDKTVAQVMENSDSLLGVEIQEDTVRRYNDSVYFSHIIGYTGKISQDEYDVLSVDNPGYTLTDIVGKAGIENVMETSLQGTKGSETIYVNNTGMVIDSTDRVEPIAGNDLYLTIDKNLQIAIYNLLEENLAGILVSKIRNIKEYVPAENSTSSDIVIPIYDVYFALLNNTVIDIKHFNSDNAGEVEKQVYSSFLQKQTDVFATLRDELENTSTPYDKLTEEYQIYESYIVSMLMSSNKNVLPDINIDTEDPTYIAWKTDETISLKDFLSYAVAQNWIDVSKLEMGSKYADSAEVYKVLVDYIFKNLENNTAFAKKMYKYMLLGDMITGKQICLLLNEQNVIDATPEEISQINGGTLKPYDYLVNLISTLAITPAQLALDPCSGSFVVTNVKTGEIKALVSYPSYDNNRLANTVDADYYAEISTDLSKPLWDYATQQRTAPGSTFKMVSAVAGLEEGAISTTDTFTCTGLFDKVTTPYKCWIYPGRHGALNITGAIENSCNFFFYELGYKLSTVNGVFDNQQGIDTLARYADLFGLSDKSGIEITESEPNVSNDYAIPSYIGQGNHNYTTVGLARYVTAVANSGTVYNLSLLDKLTDSQGNMVKDFTPTVRNTIDISQGYWDAIHEGMRRVVAKKAYFTNIGVVVAGKTGTAQENTSRASHALFVGYAPYDNPEIAFACRVAFGYSSDYAAQITKDVVKYYFGLEDKNVLLDGTAQDISNVTTTLD